MSDIIVKTTGLCADFKIKDRMVRAVNRVSLSLERGKTLVILGGAAPDSAQDSRRRGTGGVSGK